MADYAPNGNGNGTSTPQPESADERRQVRQLRKRKFDLNPTECSRYIMECVEEEQRARSEWMNLRLIRYAKVRGWVEQKNYPWDNSSNAHIPIMMANALRVKAGLFNAVLGIRPIMTGKPTRKAEKEKAERIDKLIDYQLFTQAEGEKSVEAYIDGFVDDGTVFSFQPWTKDQRRLRDVRVIKLDDRPVIELLAERLPQMFPALTELTATDPDGYDWTAIRPEEDGPDTEVELTVYDRDEKSIEVMIEWDATVFDGPTMQVQDLKDVVVPMRSENLQPVSPQNPTGAPWVARLIRVNLDQIKRRQRDGTYDLITKDQVDKLQGEERAPQDVQGINEDVIQYEKEAQAGLNIIRSYREQRWFTVVEWYGRWDVNGDGLDEDVIVWVLRDPQILLRARYLTEMYPGLPVRRPFSEARYIPVAGQPYGIGLPELMEGLHDLMHVIFNQNIDNGTLSNQMFFFYRASSGFKPEVIRLWPGEGYPLDNPAQDVYFPQMPQKDQTWALNMIGVIQQFLNDLTQIGPLQKGQVPAGKASALRTLGTTMAILQQGAAMPEQILRRLFMGFRQVYGQFHLLDMRYLKKNTRYLVAGKPMDDDEAYGMVEDPTELEITVDFDFQATLLNTNKGVVSQALVGLGTALINPLMIQAGLVSTEQMYNWAKDLIQAAQLDPARYLKRPAGMPEGTRLLFEEVLVQILAGEMPEVAPLEPPEEHWQKLQAFMASDQVGLLTGGKELLFKEYTKRYMLYMRQQIQQQQMLAAAQEFSTALGQQGQGQQAPQGGEAPPMQTEAPSAPELTGAMQGGA